MIAAPLIARAAALAFLVAALHTASLQAQTADPYDLLIAGGRVVDGTGSPWVRADVAVRGERIAAIGRHLGPARDTLDAAAMIVAPGFVDMLGHSEFRLLADGRATSKITQGVTTEITGEVSSVVPTGERAREERRGEIATWGVEYAWDDLDGYLAELERRGIAINLGTWVGLSSLRVDAVGWDNRAATAAEGAAMRAEMETAMAQGAFGLSSGLIYSPGSYAPLDEIVELARVAAEGGGIYATHMRSEGDQLFDAIDEAVTIGERSGAPVLIHHLKASGQRNWGRLQGAVERIDAARARGLDIMASVYPYTASSTGLDQVLPSWVRTGGDQGTLARLADPALRDSIVKEMSGRTPAGDWNLGTSAGGPAGIQVSDIMADSLAHFEGMRLDRVAEARGQSPAEAVIDILLGDSLRTAAIYFSMSEEDLMTALRQPWVMIGGDAGVRELDGVLSHGTPHPRAFGTFPRVLCRYTRGIGPDPDAAPELRVLSLEEAVRRMTGLPAARAGLADRGVLKAGLYADVVVFDPAAVCDTATFENPRQLARGIRHVVVNGTPVLQGGAPTGARPGRGLRLHAPPPTE